MTTRNTIPLFKVFMSATAPAAVGKTLMSGYIGEGPKVVEFEKALKDHFDISRRNGGLFDVITFNSATSAEHLLYHMLKDKMTLTFKTRHQAQAVIDWPGIGPDDHVLTTPLTCTATNWPILLNGLNLRWVDVDPNTINMSLDDLENKINEHTKIVTVVHWGGYPIDLDRLSKIVNAAERKYGHPILIIEDCAHAFGSKYKGEPVGFTDNLATFSLQAIKHITSVDGGFVSSPFGELTERARLLRWYGIDRNQPRADFRCECDIPEIGFKFHMNDVNATVGLENLQHGTPMITINKTNGLYYNHALQGIPGVTLLENDPDKDSAFWLYTMKVEDRDAFMRKMSSAGIVTSRVHERNDKHSSVQKYKTDLPMMESFIDNMICIPVGWWVTPEDREYIVNTIKSGW